MPWSCFICASSCLYLTGRTSEGKGLPCFTVDTEGERELKVRNCYLISRANCVIHLRCPLTSLVARCTSSSCTKDFFFLFLPLYSSHYFTCTLSLSLPLQMSSGCNFHFILSVQPCFAIKPSHSLRFFLSLCPGSHEVELPGWMCSRLLLLSPWGRRRMGR